MTFRPPRTAWLPLPLAFPGRRRQPGFRPQAEPAAEEMIDHDEQQPEDADAAPRRSLARGIGYLVACTIAVLVGLTLAYLLLYWLW